MVTTISTIALGALCCALVILLKRAMDRVALLVRELIDVKAAHCQAVDYVDGLTAIMGRTCGQMEEDADNINAFFHELHRVLNSQPLYKNGMDRERIHKGNVVRSGLIKLTEPYMNQPTAEVTKAYPLVEQTMFATLIWIEEQRKRWNYPPLADAVMKPDAEPEPQ
ncbi:hypothetical protein EAN04_24580 [Salmonella enterica]|nr:hypothetical protein [Salmonella enterica]